MQSSHGRAKRTLKANLPDDAAQDTPLIGRSCAEMYSGISEPTREVTYRLMD